MNDQELRERFAELREYELAQAPAFELPRARSRSRSRGGLRVAGAGTAVVVAIIALVLITRRAREPEISITEWQAPTDVLLRMPGTEWLGEMPTLKYEGTP
jgi:hypothetical protein